ncbi:MULTISPECIES: hypothetical protein [Flavobacterium]|uniref:hypothetical protein n=1 Tax=Flavobacterium TaxID=237 RepID=UPI001183880D|nr:MULTISPECIES: hypothetical protein [Flavobacterium]MCR4032448.1 hypothetical protein [Flavobacterium panacis]
MRFENYTSEEFNGEMNSYEEQLLLNYDDYLENNLTNELTTREPFYLELGELEDDLEDDFESEYDENDWEEEDLDEKLEGEYDKNEETPGTFLMIS